MEKTIVGIGEILWDIFPQGKRLGGAPANFAWNMAQLGYRVVYGMCNGVAGLLEERVVDV